MSTPEPAPPVIVTPEPDSRLEQALARYDLLADEFEAAKERFEEIKSAVKTEMLMAAAQVAEGDAEVKTIYVRSPFLRKPLSLVCSRPWRLKKEFKDEQPGIYWRYAEQGKAQWTLSRQR